MLAEQTYDKLNAMKLFGMAKAMRDWSEQTRDKEISPADLVGFLTDAEWVYRENRKLQVRLTAAKFKMLACVEDIDFGHARGLGPESQLRDRLGPQSIVPFAVELCGREIQRRHDGVRHLLAGRILPAVESSLYCETGSRFR